MTYSYRNAFFAGHNGSRALPVSTARAGNVIGGGDFAKDRIIPDCVRAAVGHTPIIIRNPYSTRPYQHVLEPLFAYLMIARRQMEDPSLSGSYNVGPDDGDCYATGALTDLFIKAWGGDVRRIDQTDPTAVHEANFLKLDCTKLKTTFGWQPRWDLPTAVAKNRGMDQGLAGRRRYQVPAWRSRSAHTFSRTLQPLISTTAKGRICGLLVD